MSSPAGPDTPSSASPQVPAATFRAVPAPALVAVGFGLLGLSPVAFQGGAWWLVFLIPVAVALWVLRTRTVVDADGVRVLQVWGRRTLPWSSVSTLRVVERGWVRAVRGDGGEDPLVGVRVRDLGRLGVASGGRIRVPTPAEAEAAAERERELTATRMRIEKLREQQAVDDGAVDDGAVDSPAERVTTERVTTERAPTDETPDRTGERPDRDP